MACSAFLAGAGAETRCGYGHARLMGNPMMIQIRTATLSIAFLMLVATASAFAQNQAPAEPPAKPAAAISAKVGEVSKWTKQQWYAAKAIWVKEKTKWANCQLQAIDKKLFGRKSWPFLYNCMTKSS